MAALAALLLHAAVLLGLLRVMQAAAPRTPVPAVLVRIETQPSAASPAGPAHAPGQTSSAARRSAGLARPRAPQGAALQPSDEFRRSQPPRASGTGPLRRAARPREREPSPASGAQAHPPGRITARATLPAGSTSAAAGGNASPHAGTAPSETASVTAGATAATEIPAAPGEPAQAPPAARAEASAGTASAAARAGPARTPAPSTPLAAELVCRQQVRPAMPALAIEEGVGGTVVAQARVVHGRVSSVTIVSGPDIFHRAVRQAMLRYRCEDLGGRAVTVTQEFRFQLR